MKAPLAPGQRRRRWAPLPTVSLLVGITLSIFAVVAGLASSMMVSLAQDPIVVRALGVTLGFCGFMLIRVAIQAAIGLRRFFGVGIAVLLFSLAALLLASPASATWLYDTGRGIFVPWVFGVPAVLSLLLSRRRLK